MQHALCSTEVRSFPFALIAMLAQATCRRPSTFGTRTPVHVACSADRAAYSACQKLPGAGVMQQIVQLPPKIMRTCS